MSIVSTAPVPYSASLSNIQCVSSEHKTDDGSGSCDFNFSSSDTFKAQSTFENYLLDKTVSVVYLYLKQNYSDQNVLEKYLSEETKRNGLQEWIWL